MFIQLIEGRVSDESAVRSRWDAWMSDIAPGAQGWMGSTGGVSDDGVFVAMARFESGDAAQASGLRDEHQRWWADTQPILDGNSYLINCGDVSVLGEGGADKAGFVRVMHAQVADGARVRTIEAETEESFRRLRPDFLGGLRGWYGQRGLVAVDYFTSEKAVQKGDAKELPVEVKKQFDEWYSLLDGLRFIDLPRPWLASP